MNKAGRIKLKVLLLSSISLLMLWVGCVDTGVQNIPTSIDLRSQVKITNLASSGGAATVNIINASGKTDGSFSPLNLGAEYPGNAQPFWDIPAGSKTIIATYTSAPADTFKVTFDSNYKIRFYILDNPAGGRSLVKSTERYIWQAPNTTAGNPLFHNDTVSIVFLNGSPDASISAVELRSASPQIDTVVNFPSALTSGQANGYNLFKSVSAYNITFWSGTDSLTTVTFSPQAKGRYSSVLYGSQGSKTLVSKVYTDD